MACIQPFYSQWKGNWIPFPCGRCPYCRRRRTDAWVFRMLQEDRRHFDSHFITLTYDPDHVPISPNGFMTLDKRAFPLFMKRLRKLVSAWYKRTKFAERPIRYYMCGEYGTENKRPHYHAIVFGVPDDRLFAKAWSLDGVQFGRVDVGSVSGDSIAYTTAYACSSDFKKWHSRDDRVPEFSCMSKRLGDNYITPATVKYHTADFSRNYLTKEGGDRIAIPRYYRNLLFDDDDKQCVNSIVEAEVAKRNSEDYDRFRSLYPGADYELYKLSKRDDLIRKFDARRTNRKL